jgi:hypothetical protein
MSKATRAIFNAGLALGLTIFLTSNALAEYIVKPSDDDIVQPNNYPGATAEDIVPGTTSASTPHYDEPPIASDRDPFSNGAWYVIEPVDSCDLPWYEEWYEQ